jgi:tetratricopeptide (TPR) repeat protein
MNRRLGCRGALLVAFLGVVGCASNPPASPPVNVPPKFPEFARPDPPSDLLATPQIRDLHETAWRRLQAGDLRGAARDFTVVLDRAPSFYPSHAGLGYVHLADSDHDDAAASFDAALAGNPRYLPALLGLADAQLGLNDDLAAIETMQRILAVDPTREAVRTRVDLLKLRQVQSLIENGRRARQSNRLEESHALLERALKLSPSSAIILHELALVELQRGDVPAAEIHARQAVALDPYSAETHATLGQVLETRGQTADAAASYARAAAIDAKYRDRVENLRGKLEADKTPEELRALPTAATVSRATLAALIGTRLDGLLARAPARATVVATDVRGNWAAAWIVKVTQAGVMEISPNHTFQPAATVRRGDLARVVAELVGLAAAGRPELAKWRAARPRFIDVPPSNLFYAGAAVAVAAGAMEIEGDRFIPLRPATGAEVIAAISRVERLTTR